MDSKIILAILIVALIGIVAATYNNETGEVINSLTSVATEADNPNSVTGTEDAGVGNSNSQNNLQIDEDVVKPDSSVVSTTNNNNNQGQLATSGSSASSNNNNNYQTSSNQQSNNLQSNNQQSSSSNINTQDSNQITREKAINIAKQNLPSIYSDAQINEATLTNDSYLVSFKENGEIIGEYEINANSGKVTGGAFKNEVPNAPYVTQSNNNSEN